MIAQEKAWIEVQEEFAELLKYARGAAARGAPIHEVEENLWDRMLRMGLATLKGYVAEQGTGDLGESVIMQGRRLERLAEAQPRRYVSVFGELEIGRAVYGKRKKQKFEVVPLDARLQLPEGEFSYLLQDWTQGQCVEQAFDKGGKSIAKILKLRQSVRSMEHMCREMARGVPEYRESQGPPPKAEEADLLVTMADCKGVPMRRGQADPRPEHQHLRKGEKKNKKQMACVGTAYTVERHIRTPEQVLNEVLREEVEARRPRPQHKRLRAELSREVNGEAVDGKDAIFAWLKQELEQRDPRGNKTAVFLCDGEHSLQEKAEAELAARYLVQILDLMHATPRLWDAAHCFHPEGSEAAGEFVDARLERLLYGEVDLVIRGLRQMATKRKLRGNKAKTIAQVTQYYSNNRDRMKYDEYLQRGYPIGTGPVEGACRHLIKDRLERTGMHWTVPGAQPMLDLRAVYLNGDWDDYCRHRIQRETERLYPYQPALPRAQWNRDITQQCADRSTAALAATMSPTMAY